MAPAEGVGVVLLKRLSDAQRDGDPIRGVLRSAAVASNLRAPRQADEPAMRRALEAAAIDPARMCAIETTGGFPTEEPSELEAIAAVYDTPERAEPMRLGSIVGQFGHAGAANGMGSLLKSVMTWENETAPAGVAPSDVSGAVRERKALVEVTRETKPLRSADGLIGVSAGCASGQTYHVLVASGREAASEASSAKKATAGTSAPRPRAAASSSGDPSESQIVFVFPGHGSQYSGMLELLSRQFPPAAAALERAEHALAAMGSDSFASVAWNTGKPFSPQLWHGQMAILVSEYVLLESLAALGVRPDAVAGHSFGEYAAGLAAGAWTLEAALECARLRADALERGTRPGGMLAVLASVADAQSLVDESGGKIHLANLNGPRQTVLSGELQAIAAAEAAAKRRGLGALVLPVTRPFHSPLMAGAQTIFEAGLPTIAIESPKLRWIGTASAKPIATVADMRRSLVEQFTRPVRYDAMLRELVGERPALVIEVGPQQVLTKLHRQLLAVEHDHRAIATDNARRPGAEQLLDVCVAAAAMSRPLVAATTSPTTMAPSAARSGKESGGVVGRLIEFDATERRRARRRLEGSRDAGAGERRPRGHAEPTPASPDRGSNHAPDDRNGSSRASGPALRNGSASGNGSAPGNGATSGNGLASDRVGQQGKSAKHSASLPPGAGSARGVALGPAAPANGSRRSMAPIDASRGVVAELPSPVDVQKLQAFLVNFVIEQTGYSAEDIELDANLEADLGLDSIKTMQLFGEIGDKFHVAPPQGDVRLEDFATLRQILDFVAGNVANGSSAIGGVKAVVEADFDAHLEDDELDSESLSGRTAVAADDSRAEAPTGEILGDLEAFLIDFVVEQTGYPQEDVDLDADLEADLGIDSIRKAQLFGEIGEQFKIAPPSGNVTLDDFPTLRSVMDFILRPANASDETARMPEAEASDDDADSDPPSRGRAEVGSGASQRETSALAVAETADLAEELEKFLVDFVVEQTGYPSDLVELDADLEADLGIDSIRKAQMFGEIGERFKIAPPSGNVTLDDFPTLRHVVEFLCESMSAAPAESFGVRQTISQDEPAEPSREFAPAAPAESPVAAVEATSAESDRVMERFVIELVPSPASSAPGELSARALLGERLVVAGEVAVCRCVGPGTRGARRRRCVDRAWRFGGIGSGGDRSGLGRRAVYAFGARQSARAVVRAARGRRLGIAPRPRARCPVFRMPALVRVDRDRFSGDPISGGQAKIGSSRGR